MTALERAKEFPKGVKKLFQACLTYKNIHDASRTPLNAWTIDHPFRQHKPKRVFSIYQDEVRPGRIPRRQFEQQRRLRSDIICMMPLVILWIPPIIGYLPMILFVMAPRQVLSRQFHNDYEVRHYAELEYYQRRQDYPALADLFFRLAMLGQQDGRHVEIDSAESDEAGPVMDALPFYSVFANRSGITHQYRLRRGVLATLDMLPREYIVQLALAVGVNQSLPKGMAVRLTGWMPSVWLRYQIHRVATAVVEDDTLLLLEDHDENGCADLTEIEVMDACLMRGLPVGISTDKMRVCLTNHLKMIASVKERLPSGSMTEGFGLFTMHLAVLRYYFKQRDEQRLKRSKVEG